jgi:hypothetical protein
MQRVVDILNGVDYHGSTLQVQKSKAKNSETGRRSADYRHHAAVYVVGMKPEATNHELATFLIDRLSTGEGRPDILHCSIRTRKNFSSAYVELDDNASVSELILLSRKNSLVFHGMKLTVSRWERKVPEFVVCNDRTYYPLDRRVSYVSNMADRDMGKRENDEQRSSAPEALLAPDGTDATSIVDDCESGGVMTAAEADDPMTMEPSNDEEHGTTGNREESGLPEVVTEMPKNDTTCCLNAESELPVEASEMPKYDTNCNIEMSELFEEVAESPRDENGKPDRTTDSPSRCTNEANIEEGRSEGEPKTQPPDEFTSVTLKLLEIAKKQQQEIDELREHVEMMSAAHERANNLKTQVDNLQTQLNEVKQLHIQTTNSLTTLHMTAMNEKEELKRAIEEERRNEKLKQEELEKVQASKIKNDTNNLRAS